MSARPPDLQAAHLALASARAASTSHDLEESGMPLNRDAGSDQRSVLSPVQFTVFVACVAHERESFLPITPEIWWRAELPFQGSRASFARHLRSLHHAGLLSRRASARAAYDFTLRGEALGKELS